MVKGKVSAGQNVLITGIGGGVAILALQLCIAKGANVYVTSGSEDKIRKAIELGAKGGANYKDSKAVTAFAISVEANHTRSKRQKIGRRKYLLSSQKMRKRPGERARLMSSSILAVETLWPRPEKS